MNEITDQNQPVSHPLSLTCGRNPGWIRSRGGGWAGCDLLPPSATRSWPGCMDYCWTWPATRRAAGMDGCA
jgi:hypothetical protein